MMKLSFPLQLGFLKNSMVLKSVIFFITLNSALQLKAQAPTKSLRERISINKGWKFYKYEQGQATDNLIYDIRPVNNTNIDKIAADDKPTEAVKLKASNAVLKPYIMPSGNDFIKDSTKRYTRPQGNPGGDFPFVKLNFDDQAWKDINLPHDWAINGPFYTGEGPVGGGMGRLPIQGVAWYRKKIFIPTADSGKSIFLEVDGAMSYAMVWINGKLAGGWPNGYSSWQVDLTPYLLVGKENQIAIRLDNPLNSSRWYPGGGIYRNVWLTKVNTVHVAQWGTFLRTTNVSEKSAKINLEVKIANNSSTAKNLVTETAIYLLDHKGNKLSKAVGHIAAQKLLVKAQSTNKVDGFVTINNPKLWFPLPVHNPSRYVAVTAVFDNGKQVDVYETPFGIRDIRFDSEKGLFVNGKKTMINGVNQHADLGALGMAYNERAAERQLEMLRELGCNAIRMSHNPPSPELLDLTDRMGFLVIDEIFDSWERKKTPLDFHLIFPEWSEQDLRSLIRRDRNHPSVILWSYGNEVGEQYTDQEGALVANRLYQIVKEEDPTRLATLGMNYAKPNMPLPALTDVIGLNYQGEGIRNADAYAGLKGITTSPMFPSFHEKFPTKAILSTENAAALSSRGEYMFPIHNGNSAPIKGNLGGNPITHQVSAYELYSVDFGASADKVFATMAQHPFVAGGFVWTGWDYLGEPTPYYSSRSSYFGIIDLAGFRKDRFYLYQSQWRPELPMVHILPHWNWENRIGEITPVHIFTSGDEAELFLNGKSLGRKAKKPLEYRLRWDDVKYEPGELKVITYKNGKIWAEEKIKTSEAAQKLMLFADRSTIKADGIDLAFITVKVTDKNGQMVPAAKNDLSFSVEGNGEIIATDNGDATNMISFGSTKRAAFNGLCLIIVKSKAGEAGNFTVNANANGLQVGSVVIKTTKP
jgi:beta-galactosidase